MSKDKVGVILLLMMVVVVVVVGCAPKSMVTIEKRPDMASFNDFYVGHRVPLQAAPFLKLPVGAIKPKGWLGKQLELQAEGFHGHLTEISQFLVKENNAWLSPTGEGDHGWEEAPYWLKGYSNAAYILGDEGMLAETKIWMEAALSSQKADGWFGPDQGRKGVATDLQGREDLWPNMIMLFCLQDYYEYAGDQRVLDLMTNYFKYLMTVPEDRFLVGYWPRNRGGDLLYSVYWLYNRTGGDWLLELADKVHRHSVNWTDGIPNWHNVNMSQSFGEPTTYGLQTGDPKHLQAADRNYRQIRQLYGQVPGGMFCSDENCREGYTDPRQAVETCGMVEMMLSSEILLRFTGDPIWADRCEDVAFNSFASALTADLKALRYMTSPNLVQSDRQSKAPGFQNGGPMLHLNPHLHRCCQHNIGHGWPYYAEHLWLATPDNGLAAVFYSECEVTAQAGDGTPVTINEMTHYPFDGEMVFLVTPDNSVEFPLYLRIPTWSEQAEVRINGLKQNMVTPLKGYIKIVRKWSKGDQIRLTLPMPIRLRTWTENKNSVSVDRGPLTYSLKIGEKYVREGGTEKWPGWEIYPTTPWNFGLVLNKTTPADSFEVVKRAWPASDQPFTQENIPLELRTTGKIIPEWKMDELNLVGLLPQSPVPSDQPGETITLIPMGAARLRISAFPVIQ